MELIHRNDTFQIENNLTEINHLLQKITRSIKEKDINLVLSHLIVNGEDVFANHVDYLSQHLATIETIEVVTRHLKEMVWEMMESIHDYLERVIPTLPDLAHNDYATNEGWEGLNDLLQGMQWILQFTGFAKSATEQPANWAYIEKNLTACQDVFTQLVGASEARDSALISAILTNEVTSVYETLKDNIALSLQGRSYLNDVDL